MQVYTSDIRGAGTDAKVFIKLQGADGKGSAPLRLENSKNNFERGSEVGCAACSMLPFSQAGLFADRSDALRQVQADSAECHQQRVGHVAYV